MVSKSPGARWSACLLALALVGCDTSLRDDLTEAQADDIVAMLQQEGMSASKKRSENGTWSVAVDGGNDVGAEQLVHLYGLPRRHHPDVAEIFPGNGLLPSEMEEHARYQFALGQELSSTIEQIDGVLAARVHVAIPPRNPRVAEPPKPTASVFVRYRSDQRVDMMKTQIRTLVAQALPGGSAAEVSVLAVPVYPPPLQAGNRVMRSWLGVRYLAADADRFAIWLTVPWLLLVGALGYAGWRWHAFARLKAWCGRAWKHRSAVRRPNAFGFKPGAARGSEPNGMKGP